jgi:hypothetical protein
MLRLCLKIILIGALKLTSKRYPRRRQGLPKEWREVEGIPEQ